LACSVEADELEAWPVCVEGWLAVGDDVPLLTAELLVALVPPLAPEEACDFDWLYWSRAACVRGPMMPSIGPGSKPASFSMRCVCFTFSSPALADWPWLAAGADAALADSEALEGCCGDDWALLAGCCGADWVAFVDCEAVSCCAAYALPAAMRAATAMASFLEVIPFSFSWGAERIGDAIGVPAARRDMTAPGEAVAASP
jgi:hypothetical protein